MNTQSRQSDKPVGIRYAILLIPLFAAVIFAAAAILYPGQLDTALDARNDASPLAVPEITITTHDGGALYFADAALTGLSSIGEIVPVVRYDTETADGIRIRLLALGSQSLEHAFVLTDGRMPQNETECVIVALNAAPDAAAAWDTEIGSAIRPCGDDGEVLIADQSNIPCTLTVVGIAENTLSALAPIAENDVQLLVYTTADACWVTPDAVSCLYLTDCTAADPAAAVQHVCNETEDAQKAHRAALAEEQLAACLAAGEAAENAIIAHEITVQVIENRLATAELRVAEAETNMMNAVAQLQAERQAFVSDMEHNEYYALRQVDLIPRRDRAEEGFSKQEEEIARMNDALQAAYDDRNAIRAELQNADDILEELKADAERAHNAIEEQQRFTEQLSDAQIWNIVSRTQTPAHTTLTSHTAAVRKTAALIGGIAAAIFFIAGITVYAVSRTAVCSVLRFTLSSVLTAVGGIVLGGCLLPPLMFSYTFPALCDVLHLSVLSADTLKSGAGILLVTAGFSAVTAVIGSRLQKHTASAPQTEQS